MNPPSALLVNGSGSLVAAGRMVAHCLLVESSDGLVLVDTGLGTMDVAKPDMRLPRMWQALTRPRRYPAEPALRQVAALGFEPGTVRHIVLTHLDLDHVSGLADFPWATVHATRIEHDEAMAAKKNRYARGMWSHGPHWKTHEPSKDSWFGFDSGRIGDFEPEIRLVALPGHSDGNAGVAVKTNRGWLLNAGDAYFAHSEVHQPKRECPLGLEVFQSLLQTSAEARLATQDRLRTLIAAHPDDIQVFSAHDPSEFEALAGTL